MAVDFARLIEFVKKYRVRIAIALLIFLGIIAIISIAIVMGGGEDDQDYCNIATCPNNTHTLCKYNSSERSERCGVCTGIDDTGMEEEIQLTLLNLHNDFRKNVGLGLERRGAPGPQIKHKNGVAIPPLVWDNELSRIAQRWANQCIKKRDECRDLPTEKVGQNTMFLNYTSKPTVIAAVKELYDYWEREVNAFKSGSVRRYRPNPNTDSYTQMVWDTTKRVGCEYLQCEHDGMHVGWLVCNYAPAGNIIGQPIYEP